MDPREVRAHLGLADCAIARAEPTDAIIEELLAAAADAVECELSENAFTLFGKALAVDPSRLEVHIDIAELEASTGRSDMAISRMENLSRTYQAMGLNEDAEAVLEVASLFRAPPVPVEPVAVVPAAEYVAPVMTPTQPPSDQCLSGGTQVAPAPSRPIQARPIPAAPPTDAATYVAPIMRLAVPGPAAVVDPQTREKARRNTISVTPPPTRKPSTRTSAPPTPPPARAKATLMPIVATEAPVVAAQPASPPPRRRSTGEYSGATPIQPATASPRRRKNPSAPKAPATEPRRAAPGKARPRIAAPPRPPVARRTPTNEAKASARTRTPVAPQRPAPSRSPSPERKKLVIAKAPHPTNLAARLRQQSNRVRLDPPRNPGSEAFEEQATRLWAPEAATDLAATLAL